MNMADVQSISDDRSPAAQAVGARGSLRARRRVRTWPFTAPAVRLLAFWMIMPLALTLWYSLQGYNLLSPRGDSSGLASYEYLLTDPDLPVVVEHHLARRRSLVVTIVLRYCHADLFHQPFTAAPLHGCCW